MLSLLISLFTQPYIMDLNSHHGTHIKKADEPFSKMLIPEVARPLHDGDIVTFGKSVGKNQGVVHPVVAKVEVGYKHTPSNPHLPGGQFKPLVVPDHSVTPEPPRSSPKSVSGRYGLSSHSPGSSSSSSGSDVNDDSDIEELPSLPFSLTDSGLNRDCAPAGVSHARDALLKMLQIPGVTSFPPTSLSSLVNLDPEEYEDLMDDDNESDHDNEDEGDEASGSEKDRSSSMEMSNSPTPPPKLFSSVADSLPAAFGDPVDPIIIGAWPNSPSSSVGHLEREESLQPMDGREESFQPIDGREESLQPMEDREESLQPMVGREFTPPSEAPSPSYSPFGFGSPAIAPIPIAPSPPPPPSPVLPLALPSMPFTDTSKENDALNLPKRVEAPSVAIEALITNKLTEVRTALAELRESKDTEMDELHGILEDFKVSSILQFVQP